jgi:hypothetical protein
LFRRIDLLMYAGFACSLIGWALTTYYPRVCAFLNIIGGFLVILFGYYMYSMSIMVVNTIWVIVSVFNFHRLEMKTIGGKKE